MILHRLLACAALAIQSTVLWYFTDTQVFPITVVLLSLASFVIKQRFDLDRRFAFWGQVGLFLLFVVKYYAAPHEFDFAEQFVRTPFAFAVGQFLMTLQVIQFYFRYPDDRLPLSWPAFSVISLVCFGDLQANPMQMRFFQPAAVSLVVVNALLISVRREYWRSHERRSRWSQLVLTALVLAAVGGTGWGAATALRRHERDFDELIARFLAPERLSVQPGFSGRGRLGSVAKVKTTGENKIALRVYSDEEPGYLRGRAFDLIQNSNWSLGSSLRPLSASKTTPAGVKDAPAGLQTFVTDATTADQWIDYEIWPAAAQPAAIFAPLGTAVLQAPVDSVSIDLHNILHADELSQGIPFHVAVPENVAPGRLSEDERARLLRIPKELDPQITNLAGRLAKDEWTTAEKIAAVTHFFHENYQYQMGIRVPAGTDPLNYFLLERPPAHCEYFASGAAVLLRIAGVPCRYVTGFVAVEENRYGGYWVARNRDAHAWVEAYDDQLGWVIVEATPAAGVPVLQQTTQPKQFWEYLREAFLTLRIQLQQGYFRMALQSLVQSRGVMLILCGLLIYILVRLVRARKRTTKVRRTAADPQFRELQRLLGTMDKRLRKLQLFRLPGETLHQFADRIGQHGSNPPAADWYRDYAAVRYGGGYVSSELKRLKVSMPKIYNSGQRSNTQFSRQHDDSISR